MDKYAERVDGKLEGFKVVSDDEKFRFSDIKTFNRSFWIICVSCVIIYMAILPFLQVASKMLQEKFGFSEATAGGLFGIPYTISACTSPFLGILIDKVGRRTLMSKATFFINSVFSH
jgi:MFS family permease